MYTLEQLQNKSLKELKEIGWELNVLPEDDRRYRQNWIKVIVGVNPPLLQLLETSPGDVQPQEPPIIETVEASPGVDVEPVQEAIVLEDKTPPGVERSCDYLDCPSCEAVHGLYATDEYYRWEVRCLYCSFVERFKHHPFEFTRPFEAPLDRLNYLPTKPINNEPVAKNPPAVEVDPLDDVFPQCSNCFGDGYVEDEFGLVKFCQCEPKLSRQKTQGAIAPAAKISKSDQNPILTGMPLSDRFLARYSPPQTKIIQFKSEGDGQLSLIDFEVRSLPEPPDPDDFEDIDAFYKAIAVWDEQNPEPLAVTIDSMCEWAPCPEDWYEPEPEILPLKASSRSELPEQSEVMELLITGESSIITCKFSIPTFGAWCDRKNRDEPPDTGTFAKLPQPKPPNFPPQSASQPQVRVSQAKSAQVSQPSRTIPKLFQCSVAGSITQPARSPPGGDA